ncbi:MAG: IclR family transcriptional regulator [Hyphomicrobiales bacterium]
MISDRRRTGERTTVAARTAASPSALAATAADTDARLFINSLEKGFLVLRAFGEVQRAMTIAEIASATGLGRSATQRLVYTLHRLGYLRRDPMSRCFMPTAKVLTLSYAYLRSDVLAELASGFLGEIARMSEEAVSLSVLDDTDIIVVSRVPSRHASTLSVVQGMRFPAYCSAPGRAMLSALPRPVAKDVIHRARLRRFTPYTIVERGRLLAEIERARQEGFAIAEQELYLRSLSVGVAVSGHDGMLVGAINVFCPIDRWPADRARRELVPLLVRQARELGALCQAGFGASAAPGKIAWSGPARLDGGGKVGVRFG